jgi:hypothetical protein
MAKIPMIIPVSDLRQDAAGLLKESRASKSQCLLLNEAGQQPS